MSPLEESYKAGVLFGRKAALSEAIDYLTGNLYFMESQRLKEIGMDEDATKQGSSPNEQRKDLP